MCGNEDGPRDFEEKLVVSIDKKHLVYLQSEVVNRQRIGAKIHAKLLDPTRQSVYLQADQTVPFQTFADGAGSLKLAGIENVSIVTQRRSRETMTYEQERIDRFVLLPPCVYTWGSRIRSALAKALSVNRSNWGSTNASSESGIK